MSRPIFTLLRLRAVLMVERRECSETVGFCSAISLDLAWADLITSHDGVGVTKHPLEGLDLSLTVLDLTHTLLDDLRDFRL